MLSSMNYSPRDWRARKFTVPEGRRRETLDVAEASGDERFATT